MTSIPPRGRPRSSATRQAILDAALKVMAERSYAGMAIETVAEVAGAGKTTIYRWWPNRIVLVLAAIEQLPELPARDEGSFAADLRAMLGDLADLLVTTPLGGVLAHLGGDTAGRDPEVSDYLRRRMAGGLELVERAVRRGEIPADSDPATVLYLAGGPVINRVFYGPVPDDDYLDLVVATITAGFPIAMQQRSARRRRPPPAKK